MYSRCWTTNCCTSGTGAVPAGLPKPNESRRWPPPGLDEDLFQAWSAGGVHPGRGIAVALAVDEQLVALPPGYDDTRDRGRLVAKLADRITGDPQVQTIVQSPDHTRCAAIGEPALGGPVARHAPSRMGYATPGRWMRGCGRAGSVCLPSTHPRTGCSSGTSHLSSWG